METIKVKIESSYKYRSGGGCECCDLYRFCDDVDWNDCQAGDAGYYEKVDEQILQILFE